MPATKTVTAIPPKPICRDAIAREQGCVPVNVFGFNSMSPAAVNYIQAPGSLATFTSQRVLGASLTGEVFDMPAGPLAIAVGAEYREEFSSSEFDPLTQAGLNAGNAIPPTQGEFNVREAYLEMMCRSSRNCRLPISCRSAARFVRLTTRLSATR